jgi:replication-associated recombination protein RarA
MLLLAMKKRGRPSKAVLAERAEMLRKTATPRDDAEVLKDLIKRFGMLDKLTRGCISNDIRSMIVVGAPGVGKTFTVESILENTPDLKYEIVKGGLSAVELYKMGYRNRRPGSVVIIDDADSIFSDEEGLSILKAMCDSSSTRRVSWLKDSSTLREDEVPQTYDFQGSFIFISNIDFQRYIDTGGNKYVVHFEALMSRSLYLDLRVHDRQAISLWVEHVATHGKMFAKESVSEAVGRDILAFLKKNRDDLREYSLRTAVKLCGLAKSHDDWKDMAQVLLCR